MNERQVRKSAKYRKQYLESDLSLRAWRKYKEKLYSLLPREKAQAACEETLRLSGERE